MLLSIHLRKTNAEFPVNIYSIPAALAGNFPRSICKYDNRELQTFTLVDAHYSDNIFLFSDNLGLCLSLTAVLHGLYVFQKSEESSMADFLVIGCLVHYQAEIRYALISHWQPAAVFIIASAVQDCLHQLLKGHRSACFLPQRHSIKHVRNLLLYGLIRAMVKILHNGTVIASLPAFYSYLCQFTCPEAEHNGLHCRYERNVLSHVNDDSEEVQENSHLNGFKVLPASFTVCSYTFINKISLDIFYGSVAAGYYGKVSECEGPFNVLLGIEYCLPQSFFYYIRYHLCFSVILPRCILLQFLTVYYVESGRKACMLISCCAVQSGIAVISLHHPGEYVIYGFGYVLFASVIPVKTDKNTVLAVISVTLRLIHEKLRLSQPEFVYALLNISNHKQIVLTGNSAYNNLLEIVAVLVLINKYVIEFLPQFISGIAGAEYIKSQVHYIVKVNSLFPCLHSPEGLCKLLNKPDIVKCIGVYLLHLLVSKLKIRLQKCPCRVNAGLSLLAFCFEGFLILILNSLFFEGLTFEFN